MSRNLHITQISFVPLQPLTKSRVHFTTNKKQSQSQTTSKNTLTPLTRNNLYRSNNTSSFLVQGTFMNSQIELKNKDSTLQIEQITDQINIITEEIEQQLSTDEVLIQPIVKTKKYKKQLKLNIEKVYQVTEDDAENSSVDVQSLLMSRVSQHNLIPTPKYEVKNNIFSNYQIQEVSDPNESTSESQELFKHQSVYLLSQITGMSVDDIRLE
ncbi:hypothetical protein SS50377_21941 [Spironucleus salmonicida]|uniref:Uncharacterized protein n=1 Tax=Spironucleus salmonicida TaxID=348837 RepID=V6LQM7_9EUKA|nr:hypothetical protein SS50377_21941 [Spironucleus salmonicida]|eukprot:EST46982.1 Hypothetical protein SS50377_12934 [Spironucleus salmonicida]